MRRIGFAVLMFLLMVAPVAAPPVLAQGGGLVCTGGYYGSAETCSAVACNGKPCVRVGLPSCSWYAYRCCTSEAAPTATRSPTATPTRTPTVTAQPIDTPVP